MITNIEGTLEIDHDRGVIYFHASDSALIEKHVIITVLRICSLPAPIPINCSLDVTHMHGANWKKE